MNDAASGHLGGDGRLSLEAFFRLPPGPPFYELEDGALVPMPAPHERHKQLATYLAPLLDRYVTHYDLGRIWPEVEVVLPGRPRVYAPDLTFLTTAYLGRYAEADNRIHGAPDMVAEIISPASRSRDLTAKLLAYREAGVPWCWMIDPDDLIVQEYRLSDGGYLLAQSVAPGRRFAPGLFPGFSFVLSDLLGGIAADWDPSR